MKKCFPTAFTGLLFSLLFIGQPASGDDWIYYTVKHDTLWDLCLKYTNKRGCWIELGRYNNVINDRAMPVGTKLRIPAAWLIKQPVVGRLLEVTGEVKLVRRDGGATVPETWQLLHLGDHLSTKDGTVRIQLSAGSELFLRPHSQLTLEDLSAVDTAASTGEVELGSGEVEVDIVPDRNIRFQVETPAAIAAVRGTNFRVISTGSTTAFRMRLEVLEGSVLASGAEDTIVQGGQGVYVQQGATPDAVVPLLPAPTLDQSGATLRHPFALSWNAASDATAWTVDIHAANGDQKLLSSLTTTTPSLVVEDLGKDCYSITLSAVDSDGFRGLESDAKVCVAAPLLAPNSLQIRHLGHGRYGHEWSIEWQAVTDARQYRVQVARDKQFEDVVYSKTVFGKAVRPSSLDNGQYYLRVAAIDASGIEGPYSRTLSFTQEDRLGALLFGGTLILLLVLL